MLIYEHPTFVYILTYIYFFRPIRRIVREPILSRVGCGFLTMPRCIDETIDGALIDLETKSMLCCVNKRR